MTIMVDELRRWPGAKWPFQKGSCHLTVDNGLGSLEELHAFAIRIGLRASWFQNHPMAPHYDLTPGRRGAALDAGAVFVPARTQALARREHPDHWSKKDANRRRAP
jgi:hypothetical protein